MWLQDFSILLIHSRCLNVRRDPARPAGEETQSVQCQEGPQALAAPLHPGQQPFPSGHQETLPASDEGGLSERKPPSEEQGGEQKRSRSQGGGGTCHQTNVNVTPMKEVCFGFGKIPQHYWSEPILEKSAGQISALSSVRHDDLCPKSHVWICSLSYVAFQALACFFGCSCHLLDVSISRFLKCYYINLFRMRNPEKHTFKEGIGDIIPVFINLQNEFVDFIQV